MIEVSIDSAMDIPLIAMHILSGSAALVLAYAAAFLYEDEERRVNDRLARWWVKLADLEGGLLPRAREILRKSYAIADRAVSKVVGEHVISWRAISTSIVLSFIVLIISEILYELWAYGTMGPYIFRYYADRIGEVLRAYWVQELNLLIGVLGLMLVWRKRAPTLAALWALLLPIVRLSTLSDSWHSNAAEMWVPIHVSMWLSLVPDLLAMVVVRVLIRRLGQSSPIFCAFLIPIALMAVLEVVLMVVNAVNEQWQRELAVNLNAQEIAVYVGSLPVIVFTGFILLTPVALILGRVIVTPLSRVVYSAQRFRIIENKKLLWSLAGGLGVVPGLSWIFTALQ